VSERVFAQLRDEVFVFVRAEKSVDGVGAAERAAHVAEADVVFLARVLPRANSRGTRDRRVGHTRLSVAIDPRHANAIVIANAQGGVLIGAVARMRLHLQRLSLA